MIKALTAGVATLAVVVSGTLAVGLIVTSSFDASAASQNVTAERIDQAFSVATDENGVVVLAYSEADPTELAYRVAPPADCSDAVWPHIDARCLANGAGEGNAVRIVY